MNNTIDFPTKPPKTEELIEVRMLCNLGEFVELQQYLEDYNKSKLFYTYNTVYSNDN
tara:strand:- start:7725 stop:7895 length:171 start_codon:yes stop_codon:yes gene_type:complete